MEPDVATKNSQTMIKTANIYWCLVFVRISPKSFLHLNTYPSILTYEAGTLIAPIFKRGNNHRKVWKHVQGHTSSKWQSWVQDSPGCGLWAPCFRARSEEWQSRIEKCLLTRLWSTLISEAQTMKEGSTSDYVTLTKCQRNENKWLNSPRRDKEFSY